MRLGFEVLGLGFEVLGPSFEVLDPGFEFFGASSRFWAQGSRFWGQASRFYVQGSSFFAQKPEAQPEMTEKRFQMPGGGLFDAGIDPVVVAVVGVSAGTGADVVGTGASAGVDAAVGAGIGEHAGAGADSRGSGPGKSNWGKGRPAGQWPGSRRARKRGRFGMW